MCVCPHFPVHTPPHEVPRCNARVPALSHACTYSKTFGRNYIPQHTTQTSGSIQRTCNYAWTPKGLDFALSAADPFGWRASKGEGAGSACTMDATDHSGRICLTASRMRARARCHTHAGVPVVATYFCPSRPNLPTRTHKSSPPIPTETGACVHPGRRVHHRK